MSEKKFGVGILGFGFIGKVHAYSYLNLPLFYDPPPCVAQIIGIATSNQATAQKAAKVVPVKFATDDWRKLVERDDIDIINVCTPNASHLPILEAAMAAGKHIYCDKPLARNAGEARRVLELLKTYQGISQMTLQYRFLPATLRARQLVEEGALGKINSFRCVYLHAGYTDPKRPLSWRLSKAQSGGGALYDLGAHIVDLTQHLAGPLDSVLCATETYVKERPLPDGSGIAPVDVDDQAILLARTKDGALGTIEVSRVATGASDDLRFELHGDRGAMRFHLMEPNWLEFYDNTVPEGPFGGRKGWTRIECVQRYPKPGGFPGPKFSIGWIRGHLAGIHHFLTAVAEGRPTHPDLADGARLQILLDRCYESAGQSSWVKV